MGCTKNMIYSLSNILVSPLLLKPANGHCSLYCSNGTIPCPCI